VKLHLRLLAHTPDTLIARKAGADAAEQVSAGAGEVLAGRRTLQSFDASLRTQGNTLNPGTTADLVTATLFVALVERML
jgi:triphosphoribosyl-dephospho-CoA synthase